MFYPAELEKIVGWLNEIQGEIVDHRLSSKAHNAVSSPVANTLILRDANGRAQVANPAAAQDIASKSYVDSKAPTFIYNCTGNDDDLAIQGIVNNFFISGSAQSMKLIINGTLGLRSSLPPGYSDHIRIFTSNTRGVECFLDFTNCTIPLISLETSFLGFVGITDPVTNISITGLVLKGVHQGVNFYGAHNIRFLNCSISTSSSAVLFGSDGSDTHHIRFINCKLESLGTQVIAGPSNPAGCYHSFDNCIIAGGSSSSLGLGDCTFSNCTLPPTSLLGSENKFSNCVFTGTLSFNSGSRKNSFNNCKIMSGNNGVVFNANCIGNNLTNCIIIGGNDGITCYSGSSNAIVNCTISGTVNGVCLKSGVTGKIAFLGCTIISAGVGVYVQTQSTAAIVELIGSAVKGDTQDVQQTTLASTVKWHIVGNLFSKATIVVDGTTAISYKTASANIYFPQYANFFNCQIDV